MRDQHVISEALGHPWAITQHMAGVIANVLARHIVRAEAVSVTPRAADAPAVAAGVMRLPIHGVITPHSDAFTDVSGLASFDDARLALAEAMADPNVTAIVLDIDSPGGSVAGATEFAQLLLAARQRKHIVAHANYEMCSAAYWLAACCSEVVASPSAIVGSVGVYSIHEDLSAALEKLGVKLTYVAAGKFKVDGNDAAPLSESAHARLKATVNAFYAQFVGDVARGRGLTTDAVISGYGEGTAVTAGEALALGMVDRIEPLAATLARAQAMPPKRDLIAATRAELSRARVALGLV